MAHPFAFVPAAAGRSLEKPRRTGLTMMIDQGLGLNAAADVVGAAGAYVDLVKIKTGTARLYDEGYLKEKLALYRAADIRPFIGGQFHEYVFATLGAEALPRFYAEALRIGFSTIEISDNVVPLTEEERAVQIGAARAAGLSVFAEVGAKDRRTTAQEMIAQSAVCLAAGADLVLVEAAELVENGVPDEAMLAALNAGIAPDRLMIELPGPWIADVRTCDVEALKKLLVKSFGPDVNVANVAPDTVLDFEASRQGLGVAGPPSHW